MDPSLRLVTRLPMTCLWNDKEELSYRRGGYLRADDIKDLLRKAPVRFAVANLGDRLRWIDVGNATFTFWKQTAKPHLSEDDRVYLDNYPDGTAFVASQWDAQDAVPVVLFEVFH